jgi:hypothetical protein
MNGKEQQMPRFAMLNVVVGFLAAAIGFGDIAGIPSQAVFVGRVLAGLCLLHAAAYFIAHIPTSAQDKRTRRDQRAKPRESR